MNNNFEKYLGIANHDIQMANTSQELKSYVASILYENDKKVEEIDRLNNIINELENDLKKRKHTYTNMSASINGVAVGCFTYVLKKLQELKDSD